MTTNTRTARWLAVAACALGLSAGAHADIPVGVILSLTRPGASLGIPAENSIKYQTQGVANADFLRVGGKDLEGSFMTVAPVLVAEQLPDTNPVKKVGVDYVKRYEAAHGLASRSLFGATEWDASLWLNSAVPVALKKAQPGAPEFRTALRDAVEGLKEFVGTQGVFNLSDKDHNGADARSQVMVRIEGGRWKLVN